MVKQETLAAVPPVGVSGWVFLGLPVSDWIIVLTLMWTLMLVIEKIPVMVTRFETFFNWIKRKIDESKAT